MEGAERQWRGLGKGGIDSASVGRSKERIGFKDEIDLVPFLVPAG